MLYIGVDLGGTNIKAALVDEKGGVRCETSRPTGHGLPAEAVCDEIADVVNELINGSGCAQEKVAGIGIGCPGTVDDQAGIVRYSNNLAWHDFAMRDYLKEKTGFAVRLGNDANVAALGEAIAGCGKDAESLVVLTLGTGVGSGVVLGGRLYTGYTGAACELGHIVICDGGEPCTCGRRGCLESYASATALIRMSKAAMAAHPESAMHILAQTEGVSGRTAFDAARQNDAAAQQVAADYVHYLAVGVANIVNIFFPEIIGFSGGVAQQGEALLEPLRAEVEARTFGAQYAARHTRLVSCALGYRAGMIGAAMLAKQEAEERAYQLPRLY